MPSMRAVPRVAVRSRPQRSSSPERIAMPTGSMATAVAVLEIQAERRAQAVMKPRTRLEGLLPNHCSVRRAIRRWRFQRSMARAMRNPPR